MCKIAHCKSLKLILLQSRNLLEHNVLKIMLHLKKDQVKSKIFIMIDAYWRQVFLNSNISVPLLGKTQSNLLSAHKTKKVSCIMKTAFSISKASLKKKCLFQTLEDL
jgi:hypothetical protein